PGAGRVAAAVRVRARPEARAPHAHAVRVPRRRRRDLSRLRLRQGRGPARRGRGTGPPAGAARAGHRPARAARDHLLRSGRSRSPPERGPMIVMAGDIGGTNSRLALYETRPNPGDGTKIIETPLFDHTYPSASASSLDDIAETFLGAAAHALGGR